MKQEEDVGRGVGRRINSAVCAQDVGLRRSCDGLSAIGDFSSVAVVVLTAGVGLLRKHACGNGAFSHRVAAKDEMEMM